MVVWLFAGGGEAEVRGLVPFLVRTFDGCVFKRQTPVRRKPGPRPSVQHHQPVGHGRTGQSLAVEIKERLKIALSIGECCNLILVLDDLDCRDACQQERMFLHALDEVQDCQHIDRLVGFAAPELEAWIITDWDNSFARHPDFRGRHERMRWWLSTQKSIRFDAPESYGVYDPERDTCVEKLSDAIIESSIAAPQDRQHQRFSKTTHTPALLGRIDPDAVSTKCPLFGKFYRFLNSFCQK